MKQTIHSLLLSVFAIILSLNFLHAQAPEGVNYQAVVRNSIGQPLLSQSADVRFTIHQGSPTGTIVFQEVHNATTNQFGLVNLQIGSVNTTDFPTINWGLGTYFLQVEYDPGTGFQDLGATQLISVPYALYAKTAGNGPQGLSSLMDTINAGAACPNGGYQVNMGLDANANMVLDAAEISNSFVVCNGIDGAANSSDTSATNEIQTLSISNDTVFLTNGGFIILPSATSDNDWVINGGDMHTDALVTGNVGIGTATPSWPLELHKNNSTTLLNINSTGASHGESNLLFTTNSDAFGWQVFMDDNTLDNLSNYQQLGFSHTLYGQTMVLDGPTRNVGIGTINPLHKLTVASTDSVIASFVGTDPNVSIISVAGLNPNAATGMVMLTGADSGIVAMDPLQKTMFLANTTTGGHVGVFADSSTALYGQHIGSFANTIVNEADTVFTYSSTSPSVTHVNMGTYMTDSLYVLGNNAANGNWVLANDGFGQAVWTDPTTLPGGGSSLWQSNSPDIFFNTGNVGIGTTTPSASLTINSVAGNDIEFIGGFNADISSNSQLFISSFGPTIIDASEIRLGTATFDRLTVLNNGNIGIGTITPNSLLEVTGLTTTDSLRVLDGAGTAGNVLTDDGTGNAVWAPVGGGTPFNMSDADGDTEINLEAAPDQDVIHFSLGNSTGYVGAEYFTMIGPRFEVINAGNSVFIGQDAGASDNLSFNNNVFVGHQAGTAVVNGDNNTAIGYQSLQSSNSGAQNTAIGGQALNTNVSGNHNTIMGFNAMRDNTVGDDNVAIGREAGLLNSGGSGNVFLGHQAGRNELGSNLLYIDNSNTTTPLIWGDFALDLLQFNGTVNINNAYTLPNIDGANPGDVLTTDAAGTASWQTPGGSPKWDLLGNAGTVDGTHFIGTTDNVPLNFRVNNIQAGRIDHILFTAAFGRSTLQANTTGQHNTAIGNNAMIANTTGFHNTAVGSQALQNGNSNDNVAIGWRSLMSSSGGNNTAVGFQSGSTNTVGSSNTFIGFLADASVNNLTNATAIGANTVVSQSNSLILGNGADVGIGTTSPLANLHVAENGQSIIATQSSNNVVSDGAHISLLRSRNNVGSETFVQANDRLGTLEFLGYDNVGSWSEGASIRAVADESFGSTNHGSHLEFHTSAVGGGGQEVMRMAANGYVGIGTATPQAILDINGTDAVVMPGGTTGQRPAILVAGMTRFNTTNSNLEYYDGSSWVGLGGSASVPWTKSGADIFQTTLTDFVGIGTNTPTEMLSVGSQGTATGVGTQQSSHRLALTGSFWNGGAISHDFTIHNEASGSVGEAGRLAINWTGTGSEVFTVTSEGRVGIGTNNPISPLNVIYTGTDLEASLVNYTFTSAAGAGTGFHVNANTSGNGDIAAGGFQVNASGAATNTAAIVGTNIANGTTNYGLQTTVIGGGLNNYGVHSHASGAVANYAGYFGNGAPGDGNVLIEDQLTLPMGASAGHVLTSDAAGNATWKPNAIAFEAFITNPYVPGPLPFSGGSPVNFDGVLFNDGGFFDPSVGANNFRPTVPGVYSIQVTLLLDYAGGGPNEMIKMGIIKNNTTPAVKAATVMINPGEQKSITISTTMRLAPGDQIHVELGSQFSSPVNVTPSEAVWFSGHLVYAD